MSEGLPDHNSTSGLGNNLLILSIDGFSTAALGPYGCSWNETPGLNRLAAESIVLDRCVAFAIDPHENLRCAIIDDQVGSIASVARQAKMTSIFMTDSKEISQGNLVTEFDECHWITDDSMPKAGTSEPLAMAESLEETRFAKLVAAALARREALGDQPHLIWIHSSFLVEHWDAPEEYRLQDDLEEVFDEIRWEDQENTFRSEPDGWQDSPLHTTDAELVENLQRARLATSPPEIPWSKAQEPDLLLAWMTAYGAQIQVIDRMIEVLSGEVVRDSEAAPTTIALLSTCGIGLGEQDWIGVNVPFPSANRIHLACLFRLPQKTALRVLTPVASNRIALSLTEFIAPRVEYPPNDPLQSSSPSTPSHEGSRAPWLPLQLEWQPAQWAKRMEPLEPLLETKGSENSNFSKIATTSGWFYWSTTEGREALFLKPDDRFDTNDVAKLKPEVMEWFRGSGGMS